MRYGLSAIAAVAVIAGLASPAAAATPPPHIVTEPDEIAAQLRTGHPFFTGNYSRLLTPDVIARASAAVARVPAPAFLMVVPDPGQGQSDAPNQSDLIALVHDRLGRPGVYIAVPPDGIGVTAQQFGPGDLQVSAAAEDCTWALPYDAGLVAVLTRFTDDVRSRRAASIDAADYAAYQKGWRPATFTDRVNRAASYGALSGLVVGVAGMLGGLLWRRRRWRRS